MKGIIFIPMLFVLLLLSNCTSNRCDLVDCQNGGVCEEGTCICAVGYFGDGCERTWISKFIGDYIGDSKCVEQPFNSSFEQQSTLSGIVTNFENTGFGLDVMMTNNLRFEFDQKVLGVNRYSGYGLIQNDLSLKLVYTAERNINSVNYETNYCSIHLDKF